MAAFGSQNVVHRAGESLEELVYRVIQWQATGRVARRGDLLHTQIGAGAHRALAKALQHGAGAQLVGLCDAGGARVAIAPGGDE